MTDSDQRPETWKPVPEIDGCTYSGYQASDKGRYRSIDRVSGNRHLTGKVLAPKPHEDGYVLATIRCDSAEPGHKRAHTFALHKIVLYTFAGPPEPGQEACHSGRGPAFNWWPEGIRWGTKLENEADKPERSVPPEPTFECINFATCGNLVVNEGRRCKSCAIEVGVQAGDMLRAGTPLPEVREHFGYKSDDWVYQQAVRYGGYTGTKAQAQAQRPDHRPCTCAGCQAPSQRSRGVLGRLAVTLRGGGRHAQAGDSR